MSIVVQTFDGNDISDATYAARMRAVDTPNVRQMRRVSVNPAGAYPLFVRADVRERVFPLFVVIQQNFDASQEQLGEWFAPGTEGALVVDFDAAGAGTSRTLDCVVERIVQ